MAGLMKNQIISVSYSLKIKIIIIQQVPLSCPLAGSDNCVNHVVYLPEMISAVDWNMGCTLWEGGRAMTIPCGSLIPPLSMNSAWQIAKIFCVLKFFAQLRLRPQSHSMPHHYTQQPPWEEYFWGAVPVEQRPQSPWLRDISHHRRIMHGWNKLHFSIHRRWSSISSLALKSPLGQAAWRLRDENHSIFLVYHQW